MKQNMISTPPHDEKLAKKEDVKALLWLLLYSFVLLFFISPDSYVRDLWGRCNSAIFFMCGKAWMNGMVPYVDFADSKGPLLWLIYGLGYLINHHSYIGVFWISIVFYTITLLVAYKFCRLYTDACVASIVTVLLPFFLFYKKFHADIRCEEFCYPFIMISLYCTAYVLKHNNNSKYFYLWLSATMGACCMCAVLIKYNIAVMMMSLMAVVLYKSIQHKVFRISLGGMIGGFVVPAIPFIICFLVYGNFGAFIQEYFLNTFQTIKGSPVDNNSSLLHISINTQYIFNNYVFILIFLGSILFCYRYKIGYWFALCSAFFIFISSLHAFIYYGIVVMPFALLLIIPIIDIIMTKIAVLRRFVILCCLVSAMVVIGNNRRGISRQAEIDYYKLECVMSQIKNPKILCNNLYGGTGVTVNCLPACKHWIRQTGATQEMDSSRWEALKSGVADFIIYYDDFRGGVIKEEDIQKCGYVLYYKINDGTTSLYGRPGLRLPPDDFHVSRWDVWLKRNIFGI